jgi:hypothetical protein
VKSSRFCFVQKSIVDPEGRIERIQTEDMAAALSYNLRRRVCTATALLLLLLILSNVAPGQSIAIGETIWYVLGGCCGLLCFRTDRTLF